ncbi:MAG TPA: putative toxin-antitoxin system toxin component, PIN family [Planktothrix sp. UBA8407]|jgi:putative toxin-antitoxin system toxin component, PIN family|nr:putative toxin-antitoxin system toxin component, PIN family [Planktothrix sp. UBA8402]HAO11386.1 putative toxin-antitoxin system toxin component, PIN family [Planktothrix sp. UBA8407]HBK21062.1 putative toxin-antitoxin system toxin component, PIN family [Planktothrix sp. UBA10369]
MDKLRFVIDTNVLVSSILIASSPPDKALKKVRSLGDILFSETTFQELQEILNRPKFDRYVSFNIRLQFLAKIKLESEEVTIIENIKVCRDEKDDKFLEVAVNGNANYLITGDKDLLVLNPFRDINIITVNEFLTRFN